MDRDRQLRPIADWHRRNDEVRVPPAARSAFGLPLKGAFQVKSQINQARWFGHWSKAVLLIGWGALVVSTKDNFLRPRWIKKQTKLHELFVCFSVLGGISVFKLLRLVLGPVALAITLRLLQTFRPQITEPAVAD